MPLSLHKTALRLEIIFIFVMDMTDAEPKQLTFRNPGTTPSLQIRPSLDR